MQPSSLIDRALEASVVGSFTRIGSAVRARLDHWQPISSYDLTGRRIAITGATSGLGLAAAELLDAAGAHLVLVSRNATKARTVASGLSSVDHVTADLGDLDAVRSAADQIAQIGGVDTIIHNAGALFPERRVTDDGHELTVRVHVVAQFLLTGLLLDSLSAASPGRVITVSSGGMYTAGLTVDRLEMPPDSYQGSTQYARAKRAQIVLNESWAARIPSEHVVFHACHPGWAATPGLDDALPGFGRALGPLLRRPADGADTMAWLAADDAATTSTGAFWHDRRIRPTHKLAATRRTDTPERRRQLWDWVADQAGWQL